MQEKNKTKKNKTKYRKDQDNKQKQQYDVKEDKQEKILLLFIF